MPSIILYSIVNPLFPPEFATFLNLIWLGAIFLLAPLPASRAIEYLAMVIVIAFAVQWLATLPPVLRFVKQASEGEKIKQKRFSQELLRILRPFALGVIGVAATQVNSALDSLFARGADPEGPAYLWYALRIQQLPLALVGVALTGALLPPLSRAIQQKDKGQYLQFLNFAIQQAIVILIPITGALFTLGFCSINLVYGHGAFSQEAILQTTLALWAYGSALLPMTLVLILAAAFYAHKNYRIPSYTALISVCANVALNSLFLFLFRWGAVSIAIATALSALLNVTILALLLSKKFGLQPTGISLQILKTGGATLVASAVTVICGAYFLRDNTFFYLCGHSLYPFTRLLGPQLLSFALQFSVFAALFTLAAYFFRLHAFFALLAAGKKGTKNASCVTKMTS